MIDLLGPALEIGIDEDGTGAADGPAFTGRSAVTGRSVRARTLLEAARAR